MTPGILASPLGGVAADRSPRAVVIAVIQVVIGLVTEAEAVLIFTGRAAVWTSRPCPVPTRPRRAWTRAISAAETKRGRAVSIVGPVGGR
jgi:hypothetical protein